MERLEAKINTLETDLVRWKDQAGSLTNMKSMTSSDDTSTLSNALSGIIARSNPTALEVGAQVP